MNELKFKNEIKSETKSEIKSKIKSKIKSEIKSKIKRRNKKNKSNDEETRREYRKGYLMTAMVILILLMLYHYYTEANKIKLNIRSRNLNLISIEKIGYYVDDVVDDIRNVLSVDNKENLTVVENLYINKSRFFSEYSTFISEYFDNIGINLTLSYLDPIKISYFGANYYSFFNGTIIFVNDSRSGAELPFDVYYIEIKSNETYSDYTEWDWRPTGTYVIINYSDPDPAQSFVREGYVNPALENEFVIYYSSGNVVIKVGRIGTYKNSFALHQNGQIKYMKLIAHPSVNPQSDLYFNIKAEFNILNANYSSFIPVK